MFALIPAVSGPLLHDVHDKTFRLAKGRARALPPLHAQKFFYMRLFCTLALCGAGKYGPNCTSSRLSPFL